MPGLAWPIIFGLPTTDGAEAFDDDKPQATPAAQGRLEPSPKEPKLTPSSQGAPAGRGLVAHPPQLRRKAGHMERNSHGSQGSHFMLFKKFILETKRRRQVIVRLICPVVRGTWEKEPPAGGKEAMLWGKWVGRGGLGLGA